jgi:hypothetical protein
LDTTNDDFTDQNDWLILLQSPLIGADPLDGFCGCWAPFASQIDQWQKAIGLLLESIKKPEASPIAAILLWLLMGHNLV